MNNFWLKLKKPFSVLAPMDDVTDNVFRQIVNETARPDVFFTEFANSDGLISAGAQVVKRKLLFNIDQHPIVAQIWGNNPMSMQKASEIVLKMGFDGIDVNMGCPVREVIKKKAGAGMIGEYELAKKIIESVKKGVKNKIPVSVKTRLGLNININEEWSTFLLNQDIAVLTMHGRTAKQMSKVPADWNEIAKVVEIRDKISPNTLIVGNGDVKSYDEIRQKHKFYGVDGVMVGRGIFQNPWIFFQKPASHSRSEYLGLLLKHLELFDKTWGKDKNFAIVKKFFKMYINNFPHASELRVKLMEANSYPEALEILKLVKN